MSELDVLKGKTIVVVDDSAPQRRRLKELYESMGLRCIGEAADGLTALTLVKDTNPDIVSLDVMLPVMNGLETLGNLRKNDYQGKVAIVSSLTAQDIGTEHRIQGWPPEIVLSKKDHRDEFIRRLTEQFVAPQQQLHSESAEAS